MRSLLENENLQIDITGRCHLSCSSCHHFCGHFKKPWDMTIEQFEKAVDSVEGFPHQIGLLGGEPLHHPHFEQLCEYLRTKFPREKCNLYTGLPPGKEHYREIIVETFANILINDHSRSDILHAPILVASEEMPFDKWMKDYKIYTCWVQREWGCGSVVPHGTFFCESAACLSMLFGEPGDGWPVEPGWWQRSPFEFKEQAEKWCRLCGAAFPMKRRLDSEGIDDVSPGMLERLVKIGSPKIRAGRYVVHDLKTFTDNGGRPNPTYKDQTSRNAAAARYGLWLSDNERHYNEPHLNSRWEKPQCKQ
jgi:hypothetical protein